VGGFDKGLEREDRQKERNEGTNEGVSRKEKLKKNIIAVEKKNYVVAIDIGTSEVVIAVGSLTAEGAVNIETIVTEGCDGMLAGLVDNSQMVVDSLRRAREKAEQQAGIAITDAYVTISGKFVRCARYTDHVFVADADNCISEQDVNALSERMRNVKSSEGEIIMEHYPITYKGTSGSEMKNPVGSYSPQLSSTYNFILCDKESRERLLRVFRAVGIKIRQLYAGAAVVGESVVNSDEKEEGVAVVDIGSGVTDVAVYSGGVLRYIATIPMGGAVVNADIRAYAGTIPVKMIETLKRRYGSAVVDITPDELITVKSGSRAIKPIQRLNLAAVIEARMSDIAEYVWSEIKESGYAKKLAAGIVLTGGGSALDHLADLFQRVTKQEVRVACAEMGVATEALEMVASPNLTMAVSLLMRGAKVGPCPVGVLRTPTPSAVVESEPVKPAVPVTPVPETPVAPVAPVTPEVPQQPAETEQKPVTVAEKLAEQVAQSAKVEETEDDDLDEVPSRKKRSLGEKINDWLNRAFKPEQGEDDF
jgi:cell division protein FtsA